MGKDLGGLRYKLAGERHLELAESILDDWAMQLAEAERDREAGEVLRARHALLSVRCSFLSREKAP